MALAVVLLPCALIASVPAFRTPILRGIGWALVVDEPITEPVDVIVLTVDVGSAGVLEAVDLVNRRLATRVAVFADLPDEVDRELSGRGVPYESTADRSLRQLRLLNVKDAEQVPQLVGGTEDEADILPRWCEERRFRSIVVVANSDHTRRLRRVLHRAMQGHDTKVAIRFSRYSPFDPDRWWQTRAGVRSGIFELEKLILDVVRHPVS